MAANGCDANWSAPIAIGVSATCSLRELGCSISVPFVLAPGQRPTLSRFFGENCSEFMQTRPLVENPYH